MLRSTIRAALSACFWVLVGGAASCHILGLRLGPGEEVSVGEGLVDQLLIPAVVMVVWCCLPTSNSLKGVCIGDRSSRPSVISR